MTEQFKQFRGTGNTYTEIATRGHETLGIDLKYAVHHTGVGALIVRFAVISDTVEIQPFNHFVVRGHSSYIPLTGDGWAKKVHGVRLNKVAVPLFNPGPNGAYLGQAFDQFALWPVVADWIVEQLKAEGFTLVVPDLVAYLKSVLFVPVPDLTNTQMVVEFPDLAAYAENRKAARLKAKQTLDDEGDDDSGDEDGDEETIN